jgi:hypothetical protein
MPPISGIEAMVAFGITFVMMLIAIVGNHWCEHKSLAPKWLQRFLG